MAHAVDDWTVITPLHERAVAALLKAGRAGDEAVAAVRPEFVPGRLPDLGWMMDDAASGMLWRMPVASVVMIAGAAGRLYPVVQRTVGSLRARGAIYPLAFRLTLLAEIEFRLGHWASVAVHAAECLRLEEEIGSPDWRSTFQHSLLRLAAARGKADECDRLAGDVLAVSVPSRNRSSVVAIAHHLALLDLGRGEASQALDRVLDEVPLDR